MLFQKITNNKFFYIASIFSIVYFLNINNYVGNQLLFLLLNLSSFALFVITIRKNVTAVEFFFFIFLLLSFWFKFSYMLFFDKLDVVNTTLEGDFDLSKSNYDKATTIIIIGFISCIIGSFLREFIFNKLFNKKIFIINNYFLMFYKKYRFYILFLFIMCLSTIWTVNIVYSIYSKGVVNTEAPFVLVHFFSWLYTYGFSVFVSILIYVDYLIFKNKNYFILGIFETLVTNITMLSRAFVVSIFSYIRGYAQLIEFNKTRFIFKKIFIKLFFLVFIFSFLSILVVTQLRTNNFKKEQYSKFNSLKETTSIILELSLNRWIGIDGVLAVSQGNNLSFDFFKSSLSEEKNIREKSFYMKFFFKKYIFNPTDKEELNTIITPGIFAFLYYSGSIIFISLSIIFIILCCALIEKFFLIFSGGNIILSNIIGYTLAQRLIHFGYLPSNTINFLLSFLITLLIVLIVSKIIWK
jgi:hypothetical protein